MPYKQHKHEFAPQIMLTHYHENGNETSKHEWMSNFNYSLNLPNFGILFSRLLNLLSDFDYLLGSKVPKLLDSYGNRIEN